MASRFFAIAASTGGPDALREVIQSLPTNGPGGIVVQHMPERFTTMLAARLDQLCAITVREARDDDRMAPGVIYIAPGGVQCRVKRAGTGWRIALDAAPSTERHKPSANVLFHSCASEAAHAAIGCVLTGMGDDGADGLKAMRDAGCRTIAQDEKSCVVYGMPREAARRGGVEVVVPLQRIADGLLRLAV